MTSDLKRLVEEAHKALEPIAEDGSLWAKGWYIRLGLALAIDNEEVYERQVNEFKESLGAMFRIVASMYKVMMEWGMVPDPEGAEEHSSDQDVD